MAKEKVYLNVRDLKPKMVTSGDVVLNSGTVLIKKETILTEENITKLLGCGIEYVSVKSTQNNKPLIITEELHTVSEVTNRAEYKEFEKAYDEKTKMIQKTILAISDGEAIDLPQLTSLTNDTMSKLKNKSDIFTFLSFIKSVDNHTYTHSNNVSLLCNLFGYWLKLSSDEIMNLTAAGLLHDIGKTKIPGEILNKVGKLDNDEFEIIKSHATLGYNILASQHVSDDIKLSALMHHEKIDGTGYPLRIKGDEINAYAKIISICDIYDAMTANRVYREKICPFDVIKTFETKVYGEIDTEYLLVFLKNIAYNYVGSWVKFTDESLAEVVFINNRNLSRPMVRTIDGEIIDLNVRKDLTIDHIV